ncbi:MAG: hypothetical protein ACRDXC_00985 [Acidimicrobiales bacterium]
MARSGARRAGRAGADQAFNVAPGSVEQAYRAPTGSKGVVVKKGRHRRFEEARSLKRSVTTAGERCPECGAEPEDVHASWCLAEEDQYDRILGSLEPSHDDRGHDPLDD